MRPLFTIHGGEYITADYLERKFKKNLRIWVPSKDDGIDLLVSSRTCRQTLALQVKSSKIYATKYACDYSGWWRINMGKVKNSKADYWIFVTLPLMLGRKKQEPFFLAFRPTELIKKLNGRGYNQSTVDLYFAQRNHTVIDTRGLELDDVEKLFSNPSKDSSRNYSGFLCDWKTILSTNGIVPSKGHKVK
jgi:hypothetical protein